MSKDCFICDWIKRKDHDEENNYYIAELETGYVFLSNKWQYFKGYTFFISRECVCELHHLPVSKRTRYLFEMSIVSEAVQKAFKVKKMNCELLGNAEEHLHWHIIPRYKTDPKPDKPIWSIDRAVIDSVELNEKELKEMQRQLGYELKKMANKYEIDIHINNI